MSDNHPINWPENLKYKRYMSRVNTDPLNIIKTNNQFRIDGVEIRKIEDTSHPLKGQLGLFATRDWEENSIIGEYTGKLVDSHVGGDYVAVLTIPEEEGIDAEKIGNETRFINDFRGIGDQNVAICRGVIQNQQIIIFVVTQKVIKNQEFLTFYGDEYILSPNKRLYD